jgi:tetratricopeptide (TPR) repeat protein
MSKTALDRAERLFAAGRHTELISLLEPQVPIYRESQRFYYLLGSACLRTGDSGGANAYLRRAEQLGPRDADTALALAALCLKRGETDKAVELYLRVFEERPSDPLAKRALSVVRKEGSPERLAALVESGKIARLYPGPRRALRRLAAVAAIAVAAAALWLAWPIAWRSIAAFTEARAGRPEVAAVVLSPTERAAPVTTGGSFRYLLSESEALAAFERAKAYFQKYRDNLALVEINRLIGSNASASIKEKARGLKSFVGLPDFRTVKDVPSFALVAADPTLYEGCVVSWKGMAANVRKEGPETAFDFLVGYQDKKRLEGIIIVRMKAGAVPVDRPLEVLAAVAAGDGGLGLRGYAIHELIAE